MSLVAGPELVPSKFFSAGNAKVQASSFDLTIGTIFDHRGQPVSDTFTLEPGEMVQVISAEIFKLPLDVTGHVTYKTTLTKQGIWALTVGIVDPGWDGPVTTTLLNFSKVQYVLRLGMPFLRVSMFQHVAVDPKTVRPVGEISAYRAEAQDRSITRFPRTFLNQEQIADSAGNTVLKRIRDEALVWIAAVAILFTLIQFGQIAYDRGSLLPPASKVESLEGGIKKLETRITHLEAQQNSEAGQIGAIKAAVVPASPTKGSRP